MKKSPYAVAALTIGILSFIQILGIEKAITAAVFGFVAIAQIKKNPDGYSKSSSAIATAGVILGAIYIITVGLLFYFKGNEIAHIVQKMR